MDIYRKKEIVRKIDNIKIKKILLNIYKIIKAENIPYTQNSNGIFININNVEEEKLLKIETFLNEIYI
jgi:hypothetical protein